MPMQLTTVQGEALLASEQIPWDRYPRPQMRRERFLTLNGWWDLAAQGQTWKIRVPFCPESLLSGVQKHFPEGEKLCYSCSFTLPAEWQGSRVLLHVGAADQVADVRLNGQWIGHHEGGYEAFSFDITQALREENVLEIICVDDLRDQSFPYGKQVMKRGGMWYTPVSGIWQSVWLEAVPEKAIEKLRAMME